MFKSHQPPSASPAWVHSSLFSLDKLWITADIISSLHNPHGDSNRVKFYSALLAHRKELGWTILTVPLLAIPPMWQRRQEHGDPPCSLWLYLLLWTFNFGDKPFLGVLIWNIYFLLLLLWFLSIVVWSLYVEKRYQGFLILKFLLWFKIFLTKFPFFPIYSLPSLQQVVLGEEKWMAALFMTIYETTPYFFSNSTSIPYCSLQAEQCPWLQGA